MHQSMPETTGICQAHFQLATNHTLPVKSGMKQKTLTPGPLGRRVQQILIEKGLSAFEVSKAAGLERGYVNDLVVGRKQSIQARHMAPLARALGVTVTDLMSLSSREDPVFLNKEPDQSREIGIRRYVMDSDAMDPTIRAGDLVEVDTKNTDIRRSGIFAISLDGSDPVVRRVRITLSGKEEAVELLADNPVQPSETVPRGRIAVIGRAVRRISPL